MKFRALSVLGLVAAAMIGGCDKKPEAAATNPAPAPGGPAPAPAGEIVVGHYGSISGKEATFGTSTDKGIRLAVDEINAAGGINGRQVRLITYDTKGETNEAGKVVTRLISSDKVSGVLGEVASGLSLAGGRVCEENQVPMITPSSTNPSVTQDKKMVFRVCFTDDVQGEALATFIREDLKLTRAGVLYDQSAPYSKGLRDLFKEPFTRMGGEIVADQAFNGGDPDFSAQLTAIKGAGAEFLFIPSYYTEAANIAIQARKLGFAGPIIGGDGWDSEELFKIGGAAIEGSYYSNHSSPDQPHVASFIQRYKAVNDNKLPDALAGLGFDAAMVMFDGMKRASSLDGPTLAAAIEKTVDFPGVTGNITIDKGHNAKKDVVIVRIVNGVPTFVRGIRPGE